MLIIEKETRCMEFKDKIQADELDYDVELAQEDIDVISFDYKLASECMSGMIENVVIGILKEEFTEDIESIEYYNLLIHVISNKLCTMQSIKNVLSYKKENNIREIKDVNFNNGEVRLTCST